MSAISWTLTPGKRVASATLVVDGRTVGRETFADLPFKDEDGNVVHVETALEQAKAWIRTCLKELGGL